MSIAAAKVAGRPRIPLSRRGALGPPAAAFLVVTVAIGAVLAVPFHLRPADHTDWLLFCVLTICAMAAQLFTVQEPGHQSRTTTSVFFVAGALLLPLHLAALMCVFAHVPEWVRMRYPWYIQTFNIANWVCATAVAYYVVGSIVDRNHLDGELGRLAAVGAVAAIAAALVNHALLAQMLRLARGQSYTETGLFTFGSLST